MCGRWHLGAAGRRGCVARGACVQWQYWHAGGNWREVACGNVAYGASQCGGVVKVAGRNQQVAGSEAGEGPKISVRAVA